MPRERYRYSFGTTTDFKQAHESLRLAMLAVEATYGEARVRLDARFRIDPDIQDILIDASTPTGEALNETFTYFLVREMGLGAFRVNRQDDEPTAVTGRSNGWTSHTHSARTRS